MRILRFKPVFHEQTRYAGESSLISGESSLICGDQGQTERQGMGGDEHVVAADRRTRTRRAGQARAPSAAIAAAVGAPSPTGWLTSVHNSNDLHLMIHNAINEGVREFR